MVFVLDTHKKPLMPCTPRRARLLLACKRAVVPEGFAAQGTHTGRIAVRANRQFRMGKVQGIPARFCRVLQLADGYDYAVVATTLHV